jgi:hypothetical protein
MIQLETILTFKIGGKEMNYEISKIPFAGLVPARYEMNDRKFGTCYCMLLLCSLNSRY